MLLPFHDLPVMLSAEQGNVFTPMSAGLFMEKGAPQHSMGRCHDYFAQAGRVGRQEKPNFNDQLALQIPQDHMLLQKGALYQKMQVSLPQAIGKCHL